MRKYIDLLNEAIGDETPSDPIDAAEAIFAKMSMLARYRVMEEIPYTPNKEERRQAAIIFISQNLDKYHFHGDDAVAHDLLPNLEDGGVHRLY